MSATPTARAEWRNYWSLPLVAAVGLSASGLHTYPLGPFMEHLEREFGWTRVQISAGTAIVNAGAVLASPLIGALVDRIGPRLIGLVGVLLVGGSFALLGSATGTIANWITLWVIYAIFYPAVSAPVWASAVAGRFQAARGMALAVALSGTAITAAVAPLLATVLIANFGWRAAFVAMGMLWGLVTFPLLFFFFRGAQDVGRAARAHARAAAELLPGLRLAEALREPAYYKLLIAGMLFAIWTAGLIVHFVPMLLGAGATRTTAAGAASLIGIFAVVGRLGTGVLLDRLPAHLVGAVITLFPIPGAALLLLGDAGLFGYFVAAGAIGLTLGSEADVVTYLTARLFGLKKYGVLLGGLMGAIALGGVVGPLAAGASYDRFGDYTAFLVVTIGLALVASLLIGSLRGQPEWGDANTEALQHQAPGGA